MEKNKYTRGLIMLLISLLIFSTVGIFRKFTPLSSSVLACFRGLSGALFIFLYALITKKNIFGKTPRKEMILAIVTGALIGIDWLLLFESYEKTTVSTSTLCYYMAPVFVMAAAPLLFKEKLTVKKVICIIIAFVGMLFVSGVFGNTTITSADIPGILFAIAAAIVYAIVICMNKFLPNIDKYQKTIVQLASAGVVLIPYIIITKQPILVEIDTRGLISTILLGIIHTGIAYLIYFESISILPGQTVAIISYVDPVMVLVLSAIILKEEQTLFSLIGAALIIGAAATAEFNLRKNRDKRKGV